MKTQEANDFANYIIKKAEELNNTAKYYAIDYAQTDNAVSKINFDKYSFAAEQVRKLHGEFCQTAHAIEKLIKD